jgi:hypothetical protein
LAVLKFDIRYPNGQRELAEVEGERALVGSASHCDVRLPVDQAAYEHLVIEVSGGIVRAFAKATHPPATIDGMALTESAVKPESILGVGGVSLFVLFVPDVGEGDSLTTKDKQESSPIVRIVALVALPVAGYLLLAENEAAVAAPPTEAPALFAEAPKKCPTDQPVQALAMAEEQLELATSKQERMPFALKEGAAAVPLYETAAACFAQGQSSAKAKDAAERGKGLRESVELDFRTRTLRIERMLKVEDYELVSHDIKVLSSLLTKKKGPFVNWVASVKQRLKKEGIK